MKVIPFMKRAMVYIPPALYNLISNEKYRLKIKTMDGKEYASDFSAYRSTPDIDSLSWNGITME